jgi:hypothetical protein
VTPAQCGAALAAVALCTVPVLACELVLLEHRAAREVLRLPFAPNARFTVAFEHSVLGSTVTDTYRVTPDGRALLVEEHFRGEGYGLPHAAAPGEQLQDDGQGGQRLLLERIVHPLVLRAPPAQRLRLAVGDSAPVLLASLTHHSVEVQARGCTPP